MVRPWHLLALAAALVAGCCYPEDEMTCYEPPPPPCQDRICGERCDACSEGVPAWACVGPYLHCTRDGLCMGGTPLCD